MVRDYIHTCRTLMQALEKDTQYVVNSIAIAINYSGAICNLV